MPIVRRECAAESDARFGTAPAGETSPVTMIARARRFVPFHAPSTGARAHAGADAAHFVEVHVDPDLPAQTTRSNADLLAFIESDGRCVHVWLAVV